ncbi:MAG: peptide chain release factor N(5)-glutamine methyltransferase [Burkholderiaceae bacterium]
MSAHPRSLAALVRDSGLGRAQAQALLARACARSREWLIAHADEPCPEAAQTRFAALCQRAREGEPLAYLLGEREFHGHRLVVDRSVLIPRPETEALVDWAIAVAPPAARVLDLGTGSGAIAIALALSRPDLRITAVDASRAALTVAVANAKRLGARLRFAAGDWWQALPDVGTVDIVLGNPPYVAAGDPHLMHDGLAHEPRQALVAGNDGLAAYRDIIGGLPRRRVSRNAWLMFEHGYDQAAALRGLLTAAGLSDAHTLRDDQGLERFSGARLR